MSQGPIRILAIDGGGIRGLLPARILAALEARAGHRAGDLFDCIAGTSTGGIIAIGASLRAADGSPAHAADEIVTLYRDRGEEIFPPTRLKAMARGLFETRSKAALRDARSALKDSGQRLTSALGIDPGADGNARYSPAGLDGILREYLGATRLSETIPDVVIPSYDIRHRELVVFTTRGARTDPRLDLPLTLVARATTAAPTYFPPLEVEAGGQHRLLIDGGVVMNNPAALAVAEVFASGWQRDRDVVVVSIGAGRPVPPDPTKITYETVTGESWLGMAKDMLSLVLEASSDGLHRVLRDLSASGLGLRYERLQLDLAPEAMALDAAHPTNVSALIAAADRYIEEQSDLLDELASVLVRSGPEPACRAIRS